VDNCGNVRSCQVPEASPPASEDPGWPTDLTLSDQHPDREIDWGLWCWENPHPERAVERIEFIPRGPRFIVAGITTSDVDEHPFVRASITTSMNGVAGFSRTPRRPTSPAATATGR